MLASKPIVLVRVSGDIVVVVKRLLQTKQSRSDCCPKEGSSSSGRDDLSLSDGNHFEEYDCVKSFCNCRDNGLREELQTTGTVRYKLQYLE